MQLMYTERCGGERRGKWVFWVMDEKSSGGNVPEGKDSAISAAADGLLTDQELLGRLHQPSSV